MQTKLVSLALASMLALAGCTVPVLTPAPAANAPAAAPATAAPATSAPATSAPATSAPATTVPATSVPVAAPAATPAAPLAKTGLGDKYYPLEGNPGYDAQHYTVDLAVKVDANYITGTTTMAALATADLADFNLDFLGLEVAAVTVDGAPATYRRDGQELTVTPASPIAAGAPFSVSVTYGGAPVPYPDPALAVAPATTGWKVWGKGVIAAVGQPDGAMTWFPSNNHPTDKATYTFRITVDDPNVVAANGVLKEVIPAGDHAHTYVWEMAQPMTTEVSLVAIGDYEEYKSVAPTGVPIRNYFLKGTDPELIRSFIGAIFGSTKALPATSRRCGLRRPRASTRTMPICKSNTRPSSSTDRSPANWAAPTSSPAK